MKKIFLCLGNCFFLFLTFLFVLNRNTLAQHACNHRCTGAADITCNETNGNLSFSQGSCNSGLACYSGAGNVCRNPYCPNDADCNCSNFTIQGYKIPNQTPFSQQTVYLDGGSGTTAQPYFFTNVHANRIHRVNVSVPAGSIVGYTLCYDRIDCHTDTPVSGNQVYICSNKLTSYADLNWHYTPSPNPPSNLKFTCNWNNNTATISWDPVEFATTYHVRVDDLFNGWTGTCTQVNYGDYCVNGLTTTSFSFPILTHLFAGDHPYAVWVHAANAAGWSSATHLNPEPFYCLSCKGGYNVSCTYQNSQSFANISWSADPHASGYVVRLDNQSGGSDIWRETSSNSISVQVTPGVSYVYDIQGKVEGESFPYQGQRCPFSSFSCAIPTPTLYPTVAVYGNLQEKSESLCNSGVTGLISINIIAQNNQGITSSCGITPAAAPYTSYRCTMSFDNQNFQPTPAQTINLSVSASNYSSAYWTNNNLCSGSANNTVSVNVASSSPLNVFSKDIFFEVLPWAKLKNASFAKSNDLTIKIPNTVIPFDNIDDTNEAYFIIDNAGVVLASNITTPTSSLSRNQLYNRNYSSINQTLVNSFFDYVKSRKSYTEITNLSQITKDGIYYYNGSLSITDSTTLPPYNFVLIVNSDISIQKNNFNLTGSNDSLVNSIAILAPNNTITFSSSVQKAGGVFIANNISYNSTTGLKIKGNLVSKGPISLQNRSDGNNKPSLFVVFDPATYIGLIDKLSIAKYDWKQLQ
jgi:hypothetical protein